jgi:hypothetical protein
VNVGDVGDVGDVGENTMRLFFCTLARVCVRPLRNFLLPMTTMSDVVRKKTNKKPAQWIFTDITDIEPRQRAASDMRKSSIFH